MLLLKKKKRNVGSWPGGGFVGSKKRGKGLSRGRWPGESWACMSRMLWFGRRCQDKPSNSCVERYTTPGTEPKLLFRVPLLLCPAPLHIVARGDRILRAHLGFVEVSSMGRLASTASVGGYSRDAYAAVVLLPLPHGRKTLQNGVTFTIF